MTSRRRFTPRQSTGDWNLPRRTVARRMLLLLSSCWAHLCFALCASLLPSLLYAAPAVEIGRLLLSRQQRQQLDAGQAIEVEGRSLPSRQHPGPAAASIAANTFDPAPSRLRFDGYCIQPSGTSIWINGEELRAGQRRSDGLQLAGVASHSRVYLRVGHHLLQLGPGDVFDPSSGVVEAIARYRSGVIVND